MRKTVLLIIFCVFSLISFSQKKPNKISDHLTYTKLNKRTYLIEGHGYCNSLVYVDGKEAAIISTPPTDTATKELVLWIEKELKADVVACVVDHWHADGMGGIDVLQAQGIKAYACKKTQLTAAQKQLPVPDVGFDEEISISIGRKTIIAKYFGPAHTADGIMVWLPYEEILFGGCAMKCLGATPGNLGDAHLLEWSSTMEKVKAAYPNAKTVVPGHGKHGDTSLITYTINLFAPFKNTVGGSRRAGFFDFADGWSKILRYDRDSTANGKYFLINAEVIVNRGDSDNIFIISPILEYDSTHQTINADEGYCYIESTDAVRFKGNFNFNGLLLEPFTDRRGLSIMVNKFIFLR